MEACHPPPTGTQHDKLQQNAPGIFLSHLHRTRDEPGDNTTDKKMPCASRRSTPRVSIRVVGGTRGPVRRSQHNEFRVSTRRVPLPPRNSRRSGSFMRGTPASGVGQATENRQHNPRSSSRQNREYEADRGDGGVVDVGGEISSSSYELRLPASQQRSRLSAESFAASGRTGTGIGVLFGSSSGIRSSAESAEVIKGRRTDLVGSILMVPTKGTESPVSSISSAGSALSAPRRVTANDSKRFELYCSIIYIYITMYPTTP